MSANRVLRGGRVICPKQGHDAVADVVVSDGRVQELRAPGGAAPDGAEVIDVDGCWVLPGAIDLCCYVREPGYEDDEPLAVTLASAARGGFTAVLAMPDTLPATDGGDDVEQRLAAAAQHPGAELLVAGALTAKRKGEELAEIGEMVRAGALAFTDAPAAVRDARRGRARRRGRRVHAPRPGRRAGGGRDLVRRARAGARAADGRARAHRRAVGRAQRRHAPTSPR
jgi:dihydroorotase